MTNRVNSSLLSLWDESLRACNYSHTSLHSQMSTQPQIQRSDGDQGSGEASNSSRYLALSKRIALNIEEVGTLHRPVVPLQLFVRRRLPHVLAVHLRTHDRLFLPVSLLV